MENKVLSNIEKTKRTLNSVHKRVKNNDEMYTPMDYIYAELLYWAEKGKFRGKSIICPCDWDIVAGSDIYSITIDYLEDKIDVYGNVVYKIEINCDWFNENNERVSMKIKESEIDDFLKNKLTCNFLRTLTQNARAWGIKSISASGYNPSLQKGVRFQDVDYSKYDICITNPPFSLYPEFMRTIVDHIDFIVLAPFMNRCCPSVGGYLIQKKAFLSNGGDKQLGVIQFLAPDGEKAKVVACDWIVSWPDWMEENNERIAQKDFGVNYEEYKDEYLVMPYMFMKEGKNPIKVGRKSFPKDYDGWMFGNVSFWNDLDTGKYDIGHTNLIQYYSQNLNLDPFDEVKIKESGHSKHDQGNSHCAFAGLVFRLKPEYRTHNNG